MRTSYAVMALLLCIVALPVLAQDKPADTMHILRAKIQADKKLLVATNMDLTEKEAQAFWPIYASYQKDLGLLNGRMLVLLQDFARTYQAMTSGPAKAVLPSEVAPGVTGKEGGPVPPDREQGRGGHPLRACGEGSSGEVSRRVQRVEESHGHRVEGWRRRKVAK
jgi:hypothetical protein